jgi:hypothetical protein
MAELKTKQTGASVDDFLSGVEESRRQDCYAVLEMMQKATKAQPKMWGTSIVGFGDYVYRYDRGREMQWFVMGFSPRKSDLTLYVLNEASAQPELMQKLGKYKTGKSCLYIKKLEDVDAKVLNKIIKLSAKNPISS